MSALLIDAMNLIRRVYEARPHDNIVIEDEVFTSVQQSFSRALNQHQPSHACAVFDSQDNTWRHDLFPQYKANRSPTPQLLVDALLEFQNSIAKIGVKSLSIPHYEADDVIATLATGLSNRGKRVIVLSTDKNFLQLLGENIVVYDHFKEQEYDQNWVEKKYGVKKTQLRDYWALTGDSTLNIKGVPKVGPKSAAKVLEEYDSLEQLFETENESVLLSRIKSHKVDAEDARELVTLKTDVDLGINLRDLRYTPVR